MFLEASTQQSIRNADDSSGQILGPQTSEYVVRVRCHPAEQSWPVRWQVARTLSSANPTVKRLPMQGFSPDRNLSFWYDNDFLDEPKHGRAGSNRTSKFCLKTEGWEDQNSKGKRIFTRVDTQDIRKSAKYAPLFTRHIWEHLIIRSWKLNWCVLDSERKRTKTTIGFKIAF